MITLKFQYRVFVVFLVFWSQQQQQQQESINNPNTTKILKNLDIISHPTFKHIDANTNPTTNLNENSVSLIVRPIIEWELLIVFTTKLTEQ